MVNLEVMGSIMCSKDVERMTQWEHLIGDGLNFRSKSSGLSYECISKKVMFGCYIMLFARKDTFQNSSIRHIKTIKIKTGVKGMAANKGSTAVRFTFDDTSFMFMNCHLTSGQKKSRERLNDIRQNYSSATTFFDSNEV